MSFGYQLSVAMMATSSRLLDFRPLVFHELASTSIDRCSEHFLLSTFMDLSRSRLMKRCMRWTTRLSDQSQNPKVIHRSIRQSLGESDKSKLPIERGMFHFRAYAFGGRKGIRKIHRCIILFCCKGTVEVFLLRSFRCGSINCFSFASFPLFCMMNCM